MRLLRTILPLLPLAALAVSPPEPCLRRADAPVASLDPAQAASMPAARAVGLVYETPLQYDYEARPYRLIPYAADSMPLVEDDGKTITLHFRDDVWFGPDSCFATSDHRRKMVASDFEYSLKRLADAKQTSPGFWILRGNVVGIDEFHAKSLEKTPTDYSLPVEGIQVLDDRTIRLRLTKPSPEFLWYLAMAYCSIVSREAVETYGSQFGTHEVGSGPFTLNDWRKGHRMLFVRRDGQPVQKHSDGSIPYAAIEYLIMSDASTKWLSFLNGTFDLATEISRDNWDAVILPDGTLSPDLADKGIRLTKQPTLESYYLGFNMDDPVVGKNPALRRALSCAFDTDEWMALNRGRLAPSNGPVPPGIAGRLETPHPYAYDLEKAKRLLKEAGYPDGIDPATGRRLSLTLDLGRSDQETRESAELMVSFFARIGVSLELSYSTFPQFLRKVGKREAQMFMVGWVADDPDAMNFLQLFYSKNASPGSNRANFSDAEFDALFERASCEPDFEKRRPLLEQMQTIVREQVPWICLYYRNDIVLEGPRLRNFRIHDFSAGMEKHWRAAIEP